MKFQIWSHNRVGTASQCCEPHLATSCLMTIPLLELVEWEDTRLELYRYKFQEMVLATAVLLCAVAVAPAAASARWSAWIIAFSSVAQPKTPLGASIQVDWGYFCGTQESRILLSRLCYVLKGVTKAYDELLRSVHLYWATCWHRIYWFRKLFLKIAGLPRDSRDISIPFANIKSAYFLTISL